MQKQFEQSRAFFTQPLEFKQQIDIEKTRFHRCASLTFQHSQRRLLRKPLLALCNAVCCMLQTIDAVAACRACVCAFMTTGARLAVCALVTV